MEQVEGIKEHKFSISWKQSVKGSWYVDRMTCKADSKEGLLKAQNELMEVYNDGRNNLGYEQSRRIIA